MNLLQGLFGSGNNESFNKTLQDLTQMSGSTSQAGSSTTNAIENPIFSAFRESILPAISKQYEDSQKDVYGDAQVAKVANDANAAGQAAQTAVANNAARRGALNSGATDAANTAIQQGVTGKVIDFENQLPFLNQQAKMQNTNNLLGLATNFLGRAPLGSTTATSGTTDMSQTSQQNQTQSGSQSGRSGGLFG